MSDFLVNAERLWLLEVQSNLHIERFFLSLMRQLDIFHDDTGIWRCGGRLGQADIPYTTKHPLVLPKNHYFSTLVVRQVHSCVMHNGVKETLTEIRSRFWVIKGRPLVMSYVLKCNVCRRFEGAAYRAPPPPPLPFFRVTQHPPFTYTGVDYAGPRTVRPDHPINAPCSQKVWIC